MSQRYSSETSGETVLVFQDPAGASEMLIFLLRLQGFRPVLVGSVDEALNWVASRQILGESMGFIVIDRPFAVEQLVELMQRLQPLAEALPVLVVDRGLTSQQIYLFQNATYGFPVAVCRSEHFLERARQLTGAEPFLKQRMNDRRRV